MNFQILQIVRLERIKFIWEHSFFGHDYRTGTCRWALALSYMR